MTVEETRLQPGEHESKDIVAELIGSLRIFSRNMRLRASEARILSAMLETPCPKRLTEGLTNSSWKEIDRFYSDRHDFIRKVMIDHLRNRLTSLKPGVSLKAESLGRTGKVDISVEATTETETHSPLRIRIEIKGGKNFEIAQVMRYLLDSDAVVICLAASGKAFTIRKEDAHEFLIFLGGVLTSKMRVIEQDPEAKIPGPWCRGCPAMCAHSTSEFSCAVDFRRDFIEPLGNWSKAIDETVAQVVELTKALGCRDYAAVARN